MQEKLPGKILGAAIEVHNTVGPGLFESALEECLCHALGLRDIRFKRRVGLSVADKGVLLACGYRLDVVVEDAVVIELKAVERLLPIHGAQLLTYLRLRGMRVGLLMNFNVDMHKRGIVRKAL